MTQMTTYDVNADGLISDGRAQGQPVSVRHRADKTDEATQ